MIFLVAYNTRKSKLILTDKTLIKLLPKSFFGEFFFFIYFKIEKYMYSNLKVNERPWCNFGLKESLFSFFFFFLLTIPS